MTTGLPYKINILGGSYVWDKTNRHPITNDATQFADAECTLDATDLVTGSKWLPNRFGTTTDIYDVIGKTVPPATTTGESRTVIQVFQFTWAPTHPYPSGSLEGDSACSQYNSYSSTIVAPDTQLRLVMNDGNYADNSLGNVRVRVDPA